MPQQWTGQWQPPASSGDWRNRTWDSLSMLKGIRPPKLPPLPTRYPSDQMYRGQIEYYKKRLQAGEKPADLLKELELKETQRANYAKEMSEAAQDVQEQAWEQEKFGRQEIRQLGKMDLDEAYRQKQLDLAYWRKEFQKAEAAKDEERVVIADQRIAEAAKDLHEIRTAGQERAKELHPYEVEAAKRKGQLTPVQIHEKADRTAARDAAREAQLYGMQILGVQSEDDLRFLPAAQKLAAAQKAAAFYAQRKQQLYEQYRKQYEQLGQAPAMAGPGTTPTALPWTELGKRILQGVFGGAGAGIPQVPSEEDEDTDYTDEQSPDEEAFFDNLDEWERSLRIPRF